MAASQAIGAALFRRARTGEGQHVRLSMLDAILSFFRASGFRVQTCADTEVSHPSAATFVDLIYRTSDGLMTIAVMSGRERRGLCGVLDREEWLEDERFATPVTRATPMSMNGSQ